MQVDYIVVGLGLAGISFCEQLRAHNKTFVVFDDSSQKSSVVAGGLYNPVVLKRFTSVWKSDEQLNLALQHYSDLEKLLKVTLDYKIPVYRKFASIEEQNNWFIATDKPKLKTYLSSAIIANENAGIKADYGFGKVLHTGRIDVSKLITSYKTFLNSHNALIQESFNYDALNVKKQPITYNNINAKHIVFSEGFGVTKNPFFTDLPLSPTKGELLTIHAPELKIDFVLKGPVFLIPIGNDLYVVGATYELYDLTHNTTDKAKMKLLDGLKSMISCPFEIINQVAGIRPTVRDRRPLVGKHKTHENMYLLNGLGTRGVMIGPYVAKQLFEFIDNENPLDREISLSRLN
ncbi:NAD(P)/FAD-dependent oxidoreductase [Hyunsoonleella pacifica]|uniref:FAD-dependent oxidoreductase n=1 Tax=Hyunsoonleella pacifica TaxID=1080224 RepID=A0A4Q9FL55_9FLAO|nr:FAD-dependent oxidoreductase [Hyunsoonleella pacifica]TBN14430.1 FAD-dependent oxidoreductase [Hyunsoonleella pacifica]GGD13701.1 FAD-dependent oxidoreductase [Hyunsoonleella pacifica]